MGKYELLTPAVPNMPWQEKPENLIGTPIWRYTENPIIDRNPLPNVARIFNSAVVPYGDKFVGVFRGEQKNGNPHIYLGFSEDGLHWEYQKEKVKFIDEDGNNFQPSFAYDPRLVKVEDTYYVIWCQPHGASIGVAKTKDFKIFVRVENPFLPHNRNAVLFPRKINGKFVMLSRPSDSGHTAFGDIFLSESPDMVYWGKHRHVMGPSDENGWEGLKTGAGPAPIETSEGWLMFYHGVALTCNGYVYSIGGAILDIDNPSIVKYRCENFLLTPEKWYEERGFVPNVCFPCATICDSETGRIAIYYGAADSYVALAFTELDAVIDYIKENSLTSETDTQIGKQ